MFSISSDGGGDGGGSYADDGYLDEVVQHLKQKEDQVVVCWVWDQEPWGGESKIRPLNVRKTFSFWNWRKKKNQGEHLPRGGEGLHQVKNLTSCRHRHWLKQQNDAIYNADDNVGAYDDAGIK